MNNLIAMASKWYERRQNIVYLLIVLKINVMVSMRGFNIRFISTNHSHREVI